MGLNEGGDEEGDRGREGETMRSGSATCRVEGQTGEGDDEEENKFAEGGGREEADG